MKGTSVSTTKHSIEEHANFVVTEKSPHIHGGTSGNSISGQPGKTGDMMGQGDTIGQGNTMGQGDTTGQGKTMGQGNTMGQGDMMGQMSRMMGKMSQMMGQMNQMMENLNKMMATMMDEHGDGEKPTPGSEG